MGRLASSTNFNKNKLILGLHINLYLEPIAQNHIFVYCIRALSLILDRENIDSQRFLCLAQSHLEELSFKLIACSKARGAMRYLTKTVCQL